MNKNVQLGKLEEPIRFVKDFVKVQNQQVELDTFYNRYNAIYSDPRFIEASKPDNIVNLDMRRKALEFAFKSRVEFSISNALYNLNRDMEQLGDIFHAFTGITQSLYEKFPEIFTLTFYFQKDINYGIIFNDITLTIISEIYSNFRIYHYYNQEDNFSCAEIVTANKKFVDDLLLKLYGNLIDIFEGLYKEATTVYAKAGYLGIERNPFTGKIEKITEPLIENFLSEYDISQEHPSIGQMQDSVLIDNEQKMGIVIDGKMYRLEEEL